MAADGSTKTVITAVFVNLGISVLKLGAFAVSGSGAMLSEGLHSIADTLNQALLWLGINRSQRPADDKHPYGYGAERYFWSLVSAMGIFVLGCGVTVYHGIHSILHPTPTEVGWITWAVLAISGVLEGAVLLMAVSAANKQRGDQSWRDFLRTSKDPTLLAVLFEDAVAVGGVIVAALGIMLSKVTGILIFDGIASVIIGLLLGALALMLALRNKALLVGQGDPELAAQVREVLAKNPSVDSVLKLKTRILAADAHSVDLQVEFSAERIVERVLPKFSDAMIAASDEDALRPIARDFAEKVLDELAIEVDHIEEAIREVAPSATHIDVEGD